MTFPDKFVTVNLADLHKEFINRKEMNVEKGGNQMKKFVTMLLIVTLCVMAVLPTFASAVEEPAEQAAPNANIPIGTMGLPENAVIYESAEVEFTDADKYVFIDPELVGANASATLSSNGTGGYLYSYYSHVSHNITAYNSKPSVNPKFLISVARGQTVSITQTVTSSATIGFIGTVEAKLKAAIAEKVGANSSYSMSFSVTKNTEFTFPSGASGNSASFYLACGFDRYSFVYDRYDVYLGDGTGGGMGAGTKTVYSGRVTSSADIPKKVVYSVVGSVG